MKKEDVKIGVKVNYYAVIYPNRLTGEIYRSMPIQSEVVSDPWQLGHGTWVCKITGLSGAVSINHLEEIKS